VNNNCQVFTQDAVLTATEEITNTNYKDFIPTTNIKNILEKVPEHIHRFEVNKEWGDNPNMQLTDLHVVFKFLDEGQQMIDQEVLREQNQRHQFIHSNLFYVTIILAALSPILIIAIYIY